MTRYDTLRQVTSSLKRCYIKLCDTVTRVTRFSAFKKVKNEIKLKQLAKNGMDFEVVSYTNENRINSDGRDVEYSTALLRVYDV